MRSKGETAAASYSLFFFSHELTFLFASTYFQRGGDYLQWQKYLYIHFDNQGGRRYCTQEVRHCDWGGWDPENLTSPNLIIVSTTKHGKAEFGVKVLTDIMSLTRSKLTSLFLTNCQDPGFVRGSSNKLGTGYRGSDTSLGREVWPDFFLAKFTIQAKILIYECWWVYQSVPDMTMVVTVGLSLQCIVPDCIVHQSDHLTRDFVVCQTVAENSRM